MRFEAVKWAFDAPVKKSSTKFVLVLMASHADALDCFDRSLPYVARKTGQNPKTVTKAIVDLIAMGLIVDTSKRCGPTSKTKIYQLMITKTHQDGDLIGGNDAAINGADSLIKLSTSNTDYGGIKHTQKRGCSVSNEPKNGAIKYPQKRCSVFKDLFYINNQPKLNTTAWQLWITYLRDNFPDEFNTTNFEHLIDVLISMGDHQRQRFVVNHAKDKGWKHLHPIGSSKRIDTSQAIKGMRQAIGSSVRSN